MQKQLLLIADKIPDEITLTLLKSFAQILSREPEPALRTPFIRAFAKIRDDSIEKQFSSIVEENEDQLKDYESEEPEKENECSFNFKITPITEEVVYSVGNIDENVDQEVSAEDIIETESLNNEDQALLGEIEIEENDENFENIEGIEVEMPKLIPADNKNYDVQENESGKIQVNFEEKKEISEPENLLTKDLIKDEREISETSSDEHSYIEQEAISLTEEPVEPPKVSLDDIEREIQEMQMFLLGKGIKFEMKNQSADGNTEKQPKEETKSTEDAYNLNVCLKLKNSKDGSQKDHTQKRHHHSKYMRSENYKEEIVEDNPVIFDPTVPNTIEDFMKVKSVSERIHRKKEKKNPLDVSWQNLCENQKKLYK